MSDDKEKFIERRGLDMERSERLVRIEEAVG
jgi:hypothetical protein